MIEIKPVYQIKVMNAWCDVDKDTLEKKLFLTATRILYPSAAYEALSGKYHELKAKSEIDARTIEAMQYKLDELMFEYCPDEMTPEQIENYAAHQVKVVICNP